MRLSSTASLEADLAALKRSAERAGASLACLFCTADEYEADIIRERRARGVYASAARPRARWRTLALIAALSLTFLML